jgi:hypothetical protein
MADPRLFVGFEGIGAENISVPADDFGTGTATIVYDATKPAGSAQVGLAVTMSTAASEIDLAADGDVVLGKLIRVEHDGWCTVQIAGGVTLPGGNGATLTQGLRVVGALGAAGALGFVRSAAPAGGAYSQAAAGDNAKGRGMILDPSDATKVKIWL